MPRVITDENNIVVWRWDSKPFGESQANEDPDENNTAFSYNLRFPGQYFDGETNLHYNFFRYYSPNLGQYVSSDPIGLGGGLNTYFYVGGNSLQYIDPKGQCAWFCAAGRAIVSVFVTSAKVFKNLAPAEAIGDAILFPVSQILKVSYTGKLNYIVKTNGNLIIGRTGHTSLSGGVDVIAAGEVKLFNGVIKSINNASGYYKPSGTSVKNAAESAFQKAGFDSVGKYIEILF